MAVLLDPPDVSPARRAAAAVGRRWWLRPVPAAAVAAVVLRLPFVALPPGADEAGFLQVGRQWSGAGGSLYGAYWVDRPPLLVMLYRLAAQAGGVVPLRLLGCLAAAAVVLLVAWSAHQVAGRRAAAWAATAACALTVSPLLGALEVNGELLAAPAVALGVGACLAAGRAATPRRAGLWWTAAGAAAAGAVLVKQNILDVVVLAVVLVAGRAMGRETSPRTAVRALALGVLGGGTCLVVVGVWTAAHGTSLGDVAWAMYPFRLRAAQVVAAGGSRYASGRAVGMAAAWLLSGLALLTLCLVAGALRSRLRDPVLVALVATAGFDVVSVGLGGGYWLHYLLQLVVPLSLGVGILAGRAGRVGRSLGHLSRVAVVLAALSAVAALAVVAVHPPHSDGQDVGAAVRAVADPGDTLTTLYGEPQVNLAAGLPSPYEHLWSLPTRTLDPGLTGLDAVLTGPRPPTWVVAARGVAGWGLETRETQAVLDARYHRVAVVDGQSVYLRDDVDRAAPRSAS